MRKIRIVFLTCLCLLVAGCANPFVESNDMTSVSTFSGDTLRVNYIDVGHSRFVRSASIILSLMNISSLLFVLTIHRPEDS